MRAALALHFNYMTPYLCDYRLPKIASIKQHTDEQTGLYFILSPVLPTEVCNTAYSAPINQTPAWAELSPVQFTVYAPSVVDLQETRDSPSSQIQH